MSPTINAGDDFLVSKWSYRSADPARGDLVVFYARNVANADYLKRVVGLPGDDIQLRNGVLFINGKATHLHRTGESSVRCGDTVCHYVQFEEMLPGGRSYQIQRLAVVTDVENTTVYRVPPDHYFVLGDNRDNSLDSRMSVGFVARNDIVGRAAVRYWDGAKQRPVLESLN